MRFAALVPLLLAGSSLAAQTPSVADSDLPRGVSRHVESLLNNPGTTRLDGPARIELGQTVPGSLAVTGGTLTIAGRVQGEVLVLDGSVVLEPDASVLGDIT